MNNVLSKGQEIIVEGKLVNQSYETKSGEKRYSTVIDATDFLLLSARQASQSSAA
jgi:single-stranded DNA-binding protein